MSECTIDEPDRVPKEGCGLIYCYTLDDGRQYIGKTTKPIRTRHHQHLHGKIAFDKLLREHDSHLFIIGEYATEVLDEKEMIFIGIFETIYPQGLNVCTLIGDVWMPRTTGQKKAKSKFEWKQTDTLERERTKKIIDRRFGGSLYAYYNYLRNQAKASR